MLMIFSLIAILFSAVIHEYMHGWTANRLGDPTAKDLGRLTLNPAKHLDPWGSIFMPAVLYFMSSGAFIFGYAKPVPFNPYNLKDQKYGGAKVAVSGPVSNLVTALFFGLLLRFFGNIIMEISPLFVSLLAIIVQINLVLFIFNLLPIPPLDGAKVIAPFLPYSWQVKLEELENIGMFLVLFFVIIGLDLIIPIINLFFGLIVGI